MKRKYKIMIAVIIGILFVGYNFVVIKLNQELNMFKTEEQILGTFITEDNTLVDAQYFVVDQSEKAYWYQQQGFYEEGTIERLNTGNVYKASFEEKDIIIVYYEDELLFIDGDIAVNYERISEAPEFIGVER
ncbi:hypothetical protein [Traorella massiliensis]|uniref:hypothetical protein n=1 Tax=Traorella massiliensis TaxID=1903263 RepID=UPI0023538C1C|nr:hypothetical protein [Traorella massiliensis]